jgi:hypothetical protein
LRVCALGQRLRRFANHVAATAGVANGERVRRWFQDKKAGWYAVLEDPQMPVTSTLLDQAHNAFERKLFAMKGFHHPGGSQQAFLIGLAHLYNLVPYQRRAKHGRQCGVEVEGGTLPTDDWFLNLQILTSGGFQRAPDTLHQEIRWNVLNPVECGRNHLPRHGPRLSNHCSSNLSAVEQFASGITFDTGGEVPHPYLC